VFFYCRNGYDIPIDTTPHGVILYNSFWCYVKFTMKLQVLKFALAISIFSPDLLPGTDKKEAIQNVPN